MKMPVKKIVKKIQKTAVDELASALPNGRSRRSIYIYIYI